MKTFVQHLLLAIVALAMPLQTASAAPADQRSITFQGVLSQNGIALSGVHVLQFRIYDSAADGMLLYTTQQKTWLNDGRFAVVLELPESLLSGFPNGPVAIGNGERWWSVAVIQLPGGAALTGGVVEELPRQLLTAVPQALVARRSGGLQFGDTARPLFLLEPPLEQFANEAASIYLLGGNMDLVVRSRHGETSANEDPRPQSVVVHRFKSNGDYEPTGTIRAGGNIESTGNLEGRDVIATNNMYATGNVSGRTVTVRGADLAERFEIGDAIAPGGDSVRPAAGLLVSIDPARAGALRVSSEAYDRRVAGAISGANAVEAGVILGDVDGLRYINGPHPVAMVGRVWVFADESAGRIEPGDRLTTSGLKPGHAMRVSDEAKAPGAVVGKAMTGVDPETGMVLVLINLQ